MTSSAAQLLMEDWHPLPQRVKDYIRDLETNVDPAGTVRDAFALRQNCEALSLKVQELRAALAKAQAAPPDWQPNQPDR